MLPYERLYHYPMTVLHDLEVKVADLLAVDMTAPNRQNQVHHYCQDIIQHKECQQYLQTTLSIVL